MTNEFLKKEIEEVDKEILTAGEDLCLSRKAHLQFIRNTLKECQEKHNKFVEKLKEELEKEAGEEGL